MVEEGIREAGEALAGQRGSGTAGQQGGGAEPLEIGSKVRLEGGGTGQVSEVRPDGKVGHTAGSVRMVTDRLALRFIETRRSKSAARYRPLPERPRAPRWRLTSVA